MAHLGKADWSDSDRVKRMAKSYQVRYDKAFWTALRRLLKTSERHTVADFGCGPGLLLVDIAKQYGARMAHALDESEEMLLHAKKAMSEAGLESYSVHQVNFDCGQLPLNTESINMGFCGFMLHEVADPQQFLMMVQKTIAPGGVFVVYDFASGNKDAFVRVMSEQGMDSNRAENRYPHMCKHSATDIESLLKNAGFSSITSIILDEMRVIAVAFK